MTFAKKKNAKQLIDLYTVNVGNTHITSVAWRNGKFADVSTWNTSDRTNARHEINKHFARSSTPISVVLSGVVPVREKELAQSIRALGQKVLIFRSSLPVNMEILPRPSQNVGDDRVAAALGALAVDSTRPWIVVDAGTAVTVNLVLPGHGKHPPRFEGGLIFPGKALSFSALSNGTAQLPTVSGSIRRRNNIGRSTEEAILYGVNQAHAAAAVGLTCDLILRETGPNVGIMLTGGGADKFFRARFEQTFGKRQCFHDNMLVHRGLYFAWLSWKKNEQ